MNSAVMKNALVSVLGLVGIAIGYVTFPIVLSSAEEVRLATNIAEYTGVSSMNGIGPLIIYVAWLFASLAAFGIGGYGAVKAAKGSN